ncbi:MAG: transcription antitermination factor NusB [Desulfobacterales bacterium]|nr:transcription antitermination factor NusB [Desulfobacterales bacterium]
MGARRQSRELAMQALFDMDMSHDISVERFALFCQNFSPPKKAEPFFTLLVNGVLDNKANIDTLIDDHSSNWKIGRISCVDRNIMRVAIYEMIFCQDIPIKVSINEAIDIGKKFGTDESGAFINGILDSIQMALSKEEKKV